MPAAGGSEGPTVTPFLWFDGKAEVAACFYVSLFPEGRIVETRRSTRVPGATGGVSAVTFALGGQRYIAFNGGPHFAFTPAVSLFVECETQAEVDRLWSALLDGGMAQRCGWLKNRYGLSWQIVPRRLGELLEDPDAARVGRVMSAMMGMIKLDIVGLEAAHGANAVPGREADHAPG